MLLKKKLPILKSIVNIYLFSHFNISWSNQKCFIFFHQFYGSISLNSLNKIKFFFFSIYFILRTKKILRVPLYYIISSRSWRSTNHTIFVIKKHHFILHQKRRSVAILFRNYSSIVLRDELKLLDWLGGKEPHSSSS